jgi:hypothetical protein
MHNAPIPGEVYTIRFGDVLVPAVFHTRVVTFSTGEEWFVFEINGYLHFRKAALFNNTPKGLPKLTYRDVG